MLEVMINSRFPCWVGQTGQVKTIVSGHLDNLQEIVSHLETHQKLDDTLVTLINKNRRDFSLIVESESYVFAVVDRIKSHPLYYSSHSDRCVVSNCANKILSTLPDVHRSSQSLLEFSMAGYVLGQDTLYEDIKQLQAGEMLLCRQSDSVPEISRYYRYLPQPNSTLDFETSLGQLASILDGIMDELISNANGRAIFVPLSGGLDSRFILAKLVEKKYGNVTAFTYGIQGNHEMQHAESVAKTLQVPWIKLPADERQARRLYTSNVREQYEQYTHALTTIPFYTEFEAINHLVDHRLIPSDAIIVNGQSGDYITGGHARAAVLADNVTLEMVFDYIIDKHFSLWLCEKSSENIALIKKRLQRQYDEMSSPSNLAAFYECWEWQERQSKNVIRGQRLYEFFGFSWDLPLWHADLMDFYATMPYDFKSGQRLYIEYLQRYNYKNLFSCLRQKVQPWVLRYRWIPWVAKFVQLTRGQQAKQQYYKSKDYYSTYHHQYALLGHDYYLKHYKTSRNPESFIVRDLLDRLYQ